MLNNINRMDLIIFAVATVVAVLFLWMGMFFYQSLGEINGSFLDLFVPIGILLVLMVTTSMDTVGKVMKSVWKYVRHLGFVGVSLRIVGMSFLGGWASNAHDSYILLEQRPAAIFTAMSLLMAVVLLQDFHLRRCDHSKGCGKQFMRWETVYCHAPGLGATSPRCPLCEKPMEPSLFRDFIHGLRSR